MQFFEVSGPELWGDYGRILFQGMTAHLERRDGMLQLERAGPFMPPISFSGLDDVIVTDEFRRVLEASPFGHLKFKPVIKARIVDLPWHTWDRTAEEPPLYQRIREPEDYVLNFPHSQETADKLGDVWEVLLEDGVVLHSNLAPVSGEDIEKILSMLSGGRLVPTSAFEPPMFYVDGSTSNGEHFLKGKIPDAGRFTLVSAIGKTLLEELAGEWVRFEEVEVR